MALGPLQQALLTVLYRTKDELTTIEIYETLRAIYKPLSPASIFITLDRMSRKGFIASRKTEPLPERGGKARLLYKITKDGRAVLRQAENMQAAVSTLKPSTV
jgi:DNA-binding PadR family transcriptional regulator